VYPLSSPQDGAGAEELLHLPVLGEVYPLSSPQDGAGAEELLHLLLLDVPGQAPHSDYEMILWHVLLCRRTYI